MSTVPCPELTQNKKCYLYSCFFSHSNNDPPIESEKVSDKQDTLPKTKSAKQMTVSKRKTTDKTENLDSIDNETNLQRKRAKTTFETLPQKNNTTTKTLQSSNPLLNPDQPLSSIPKNNDNTSSISKIPDSSVAKTLGTSVSKIPNTSISTTPIDSTSQPDLSNKPDVLSLAPRPITPYPPAPQPQRNQFLKLIYQELCKKKVSRPKAMAINQEFEIAKNSSKLTYNQQIKSHIIKLKKEKIIGKTPEEDAELKAKDLQKQWNSQLKTLIHTKLQLKQNGFVVDRVASVDNQSFTEAKCARCGRIVNPQQIMDSGKCTYHWGKLSDGSTFFFFFLLPS